MTTTKIIIAIVAIAALALTVVGVATAAQVAQNQYYTNTTPNTQAQNNGVWGWIGNCFGYNSAQEQYVAPPAGVNATAPAPYQGGYGYGYGPCWAWR